MFASNTSQVSSDANWIEECFQTHLYTGNGSTQTITNGIDLAGKGGLIWTKSRSSASYYHTLRNTQTGVLNYLVSNSTDAEQTNTAGTNVYQVNSNGYELGLGAQVNASGATYASWTFRKQPKFFDVVTYTGNGSARTIAHSLGSVPGCIIVKRTDTTGNWQVYHNGLTSAAYSIQLNLTNAQASATTVWNSTTPTSTVFSIGTDATVNASGGTYVAYIFAHDAGGFGLTGTDNVISCGSFTSGGSGEASVNLGYEPQLIIWKSTGYAQNWYIHDNMRGLVAPNASSSGAALYPNTSGAESNPNGNTPFISATGFSWDGTVNSTGNTGETYIYIAIRRGPMKVPTSGTSVFSPNAVSTDASAVTTNFPVDLSFESPRSGSSNIFAQDRLRGANKILYTYSTDAESTAAGSASNFQSNTSVQPSIYGSGTSLIFWNFQRAPSFFDEVCYTGTGTARTVTHNLGVAPEMMIVKNRSNTTAWAVYSPIGATKVLTLNTTNAETTFSGSWNDTAPTSSVFTVGTATGTNQSGDSYVAYLFASTAGVSKVGSYTGTGATQTISCGFTGGARFVLIKRTDSTGDWYVWDSARGIVAGNDPYLLLNSTAAEVTTTDYIDTYSAGFEISSTAPAAINASGGTFIFLAIA